MSVFRRRVLTPDMNTIVEEYDVAPVMRNYSAERGPGGQFNSQAHVYNTPDGSRKRPNDWEQHLIDKIEEVCRLKMASLKVLQRAPGVVAGRPACQRPAATAEQTRRRGDVPGSAMGPGRQLTVRTDRCQPRPCHASAHRRHFRTTHVRRRT